MARRITARRTAPPATAPTANLPIGEALELVLAEWNTTPSLTDQTRARMGETLTRFTTWLTAASITGLEEISTIQVAAFIDAPTSDGSFPQNATRHNRRTALRMFFRTLRALERHGGDPTADLDLPPRTRTAARPLTDDEVALCRLSAQTGAGARSPLRAVAWALGEATAVSSEITVVAISDVDDPHAPTAVSLPGTRRHDRRTGQLTTWGRCVIAARITELTSANASAGALLAYGGAAPPGGAKAQASVCNALRDVLDAAGLSGEADVRPASLRNWAGRAAYDSGQTLEAVACMLGCRSLDTAAEDIALTWRVSR